MIIPKVSEGNIGLTTLLERPPDDLVCQHFGYSIARKDDQ